MFINFEIIFNIGSVFLSKKSTSDWLLNADLKDMSSPESHSFWIRAAFSAFFWSYFASSSAKISFKGFLSMLDAAMLNYYTRNVSHWRCVFCFLLPREFRLIQAGDYQLNEKALDTLCLSILHFPLRMGDHLLKVSYSQNGIFDVCKSPKQRIKFLKVFCPLKWNKKKI